MDLPYTKLLKNGELIHGTVAEVDDERVRLDDGREFTFDYAVICTGGEYPGFIKCTRAIDGHDVRAVTDSRW